MKCVRAWVGLCVSHLYATGKSSVFLGQGYLKIFRISTQSLRSNGQMAPQTALQPLRCPNFPMYLIIQLSDSTTRDTGWVVI